jgi:hypothetical protein
VSSGDLPFEFGLETAFCDLFTSVPSGKCWDSAFEWAKPFQVTGHIQTTIQRNEEGE